MTREYEHVTYTEKVGPGGDIETTGMHPAFAQIGASRVSGHATLYGSEFNHQHFMTVTIRRSEVHRNLSRDWHFGLDELIEVAMSESQWAHFVSAPNAGMGAPCTIQHIGRQSVPQIPEPTPKNDTFKREVARRMEKSREDLRALLKNVEESKLSEKMKDELRRLIGVIDSGMSGSINFICDQFGEHMENVTNAAKSEVVAFAMHAFAGLGLESAKKMIGYDGDKQ